MTKPNSLTTLLCFDNVFSAMNLWFKEAHGDFSKYLRGLPSKTYLL